MPVTAVNFTADQLAEMGDLQAAIRETRREWKALQNEMSSDVKGGRGVDPVKSQKSAELQSRESYYLEADRDRKFAQNYQIQGMKRSSPRAEYELNQDRLSLSASARSIATGSHGTTRDYISASREADRAYTSYHREISIEKGRLEYERNLAKFNTSAHDVALRENQDHDFANNPQRKLEQAYADARRSGGGAGFFGKAVSFLNVHNPHGQIRNLMHGRVNQFMFEGAGNAISGIGKFAGNAGWEAAGMEVAAGAGVAAPYAYATYLMATKAANLEEQDYQDQVTAQQSALRTATENHQIAFDSRFNNAQQQTEWLKQRKDNIRHTKLVMTKGSTYGFSGARSKFIQEAEERALNIEAQFTPGSKIRATGLSSADFTADSGKNTGEMWAKYGSGFFGEVAARGKEKDATWWSSVFNTARSRTTGYLSGDRAMEYQRDAQTAAERKLAGRVKLLDDEERLYNADPANKARDLERDHQLRTIERWNIEKFCQWNPI